jgi:translocation and assembly module TamB
MKKVLIILISLIVLILGALVVAANSSYVLQKVLDRVAPDYNLSYRSISGNVLSGVRVKGLQYNKREVAEEIGFRWNPVKLLSKQLSIGKITFEGIDIDTVKKLVASFDANTSEADSTQETSHTSLPFSVRIGSAHISLRPFVQQGIAFNSVALRASGLFYASDSLEVQKAAMQIESNVTDIAADASLKKRILTLRTLSLKKIDTKAIEALLGSLDKNGSVSAKPKRELATEPNPLLPQKIVLERVHADTLRAVYPPVHLQTLVLEGRNIAFYPEKMIVSDGLVDVNVMTNLTSAVEHGHISNNTFSGDIVLTPHNRLYTLYKLPLRKKAIGSVNIDFNMTKERISADVRSHARNILQLPKTPDGNATEIKIDVDALASHVVFDIPGMRLRADTMLTVATPYTKELKLDNHLSFSDNNLTYGGRLQTDGFKGIDENLTKPLRHLVITYKGTTKRIKAELDAESVKGSLHSSDFRQGMLTLRTKAPIALATLFALPPALSEARVGMVLEAPIDFAAPVPLHVHAKMFSNLVNADANLTYGKKVTLRARAAVPSESLLRELDPNIKWEALSPLTLQGALGTADTITVRAQQLKADVAIRQNGDITGRIALPGITATLQGNRKDVVVIHSDVDSLKKVSSAIGTFYAMDELPKMEGSLSLDTILMHDGNASLQLRANHIVYYADRVTTHELDDVSLMVSKEGSDIMVNSYYCRYNGMEIYASKPSVISLKKQLLTIVQAWVNNQLKLSGKLDLASMKGEIDAKAQKLHIVHELADADVKIDLKTVFEGNSTDIRGKIIVLDGNIHYDLGTKTFPSDSDIVIVKKHEDNTSSSFMDTLSMLINVDTQHPIIYKEGPADIQAKAELVIHKGPDSAPVVLGSIDIVDGSSYMFQGKRFVLEKSHIYLTGDPLKPLLDLKVKYKGLKYLVTITITGTPAVPNIMLSSVPSLTKAQILSLILFDSEEVAGTNDANSMMKMMGGAMAKSALNDLGVKIDHLVIGEGSVEVGKKLTDKTTVIYINGDVPKMEVKYEYNPHVDVVIGASERSESLDVVYKNDFHIKDGDIVIRK